MFQKVNIEALQKVTSQNFNDFGNYGRYTFDVVTADLFGTGSWYTGFVCVDGGSSQLRIGNGRIYVDGVGYYNDTDGGDVIDLLSVAPVANELWVAIVVAGSTILTNTRPTTFLTDATSRSTVSRPSAQESRRFAAVDKVVGRASADPQYPAILPGNVPVAYVRLGPSGIVSIVPSILNKAPSTVGCSARLDENDIWRADVGASIDSLGTNMAAIAARIGNAATQYFVRSIAADVARIKESLKLPQTYTLYQNDHYLDASLSDTTNVDFLATVMEGIRFPAANTRDAQLGLLNPYDANVVTIGGMLIPKYVESVSLSNGNHDVQVNIGQYQYQELQLTQKTMVRARIRVGSWFTACTNWLWFTEHGGTSGGAYDKLTGVFRLNSGESFEVFPADRYLLDGGSGVNSHVPVRIRGIWQDGFEETAYTQALKITKTVAGSLCGNTFVNPADGWIVGLNLFFAEKAATGDVRVLLSEVGDNGIPDLKAVIAEAVISAADIKISTSASKAVTPVRFAPLVVGKKGKRYAFQLVTASPHRVWQSKDNKLANGSYFVSTDGAWPQGDLTLDICFQVVTAKHDTPQVEVQLQPLSLDGGICNIDVLAQQYVPQSGNISYQAQINGVWRDITSFYEGSNPLTGLPPLLPFKAVFTGSRDMMPGLGVGPLSRVTTMRPRSDFKHISTTRTTPSGSTVTHVEVEVRLEAWRGVGNHTHGIYLRTGAGFTTIVNPTATQDIVAPDDPQALLRTAIFTIPAASTYKIEQRGTTTNVVTTFHVAERTDVGTA